MEQPITGVAGPSRRKTTVERKQSSVAPTIVADPSTNMIFRRHVRFWDRSNKGYITPIDTATGFMNLGYGVIISLTFGTFLTVMLAYATQDSWVPDPRCRVNVQKLMRSRRRHHHPLHDEYGNFDNSRFDELFDKCAQWDLSGNVITLSEVLQMANDYNGYGANPAAWARAAIEWSGLYLLIGKGGVFKKSDVRAVFDGSLFYRMHDSSRLTVKGGAAHHQQASNLAMFPQAAVRLIEKQLNSALGTLPRSTSTALERRVHDWLSGGHEEHRPGRIGSGPRLMDGPDNSNGFSHDYQQKTRNQRDGGGDTLVQERLTGTKRVSLDQQSFALTGIQGYNGWDRQQDLPNENMSSPITNISAVMLSGLRPDGQDYYSETPLKDWIGSTQLSGVCGSSLYEQQNFMEPNTRESAARSSWLVHGPFDDESKEVDDEETSRHHDIMETFTLSGVRADSATEVEKKKGLPIVQLLDKEEQAKPGTSLTALPIDDHTTLPIVRAPTDEEASNERITSSLLTGVRQEISFSLGTRSFPIVEEHDRSNQETPVLEPGTLSGLHHELYEEDTRSLIPIVEAPTATDTTERKQPSSFEPVALFGLHPLDTTNTTFSFVQAPESKNSQPPSVFEPIILSGLRGYDGYSSFFVQEPEGVSQKHKGSATFETVSLPGLRNDKAFDTFVQEPTDYVPKRESLSLEPITLSGLVHSGHTYTGFVEESSSSDEEPGTPTSMEPIALTGIRDIDRGFTCFVQEPALYEEHKRPFADLEPVSLSGLRTDREYAGFVQEPNTFEPLSPIDFEPSKLTGIRTDREYTGYVKEPSDLEPKKSAGDIEPVLLTGLRKSSEYVDYIEEPDFVESKEHEAVSLSGVAHSFEALVTSRFVEASTDHKPKDPTAIRLEDVVLSGLSQDGGEHAGFVQEPATFEKQPVDLEEVAKPVPLHSLRKDVEYVSFVKEPEHLEKAPIDLEEAAKPAPLHHLRDDQEYASFVDATGYEKAVRHIKLEQPTLGGIACAEDDNTKYLGFIEEPIGYMPKKPVEFEPVALGGLHPENREIAGFVEAPEEYQKPKKPVALEPAALSGLQREDNGSLSGLRVEEDVFTPFVSAPTDYPTKKMPVAELEPVTLSCLREDEQQQFDSPLPIVAAPADAEPRSMAFVPEKIQLAGMNKRKRKSPLKNWLNTGVLEGVSQPSSSNADNPRVYASPIEQEEDVQEEQVDLEQYRRAFPLSGLSNAELQRLSLKNWLNTGALPGTIVNQDDGGLDYWPYEQTGKSIPADYIQKPDEEAIPYMGGNISNNADTTPLKNWLNMDVLPGTTDAEHALYEKPVTVEEKPEPPVDLAKFRTPVPLPGIDKTAVRLKNWLNTSALPGVVQQQDSASSVYDKAGESIPADYIQIQKDMQDEVKALSGTVTNDELGGGGLPLKNWLSVAPLPGVEGSIYGEPRELTAADYIEPPSVDMLGEVKLSGVLSEEEEEQRHRRRSSSTEDTLHTEWDDEHSISTTEALHFDAPLSPQKSASFKYDKLSMTRENWPSLAEIVEQKEE